MLVLTTEPNATDTIQAALDAIEPQGEGAGEEEAERPVVYGVSVATDGLTTSLMGAGDAP